MVPRLSSKPLRAVWKQKRACPLGRLLFMYGELVVFLPLLDLGLSQTDNVLLGVGGSFAADAVQEVQAAGGLVQILLVTCGIAQRTDSVLLNQGSSLGVVLTLADDLLHGMNLLSVLMISAHALGNIFVLSYYTRYSREIKGKYGKFTTIVLFLAKR